MWGIEKLFGKEERAERIVGLDAADALIGERKREASLMPEAKETLAGIRSALAELGASIRDLGNAGVPLDASERLKQLGASNRANMLTHLDALHKGISVPSICEFGPVSAFYFSVVGILKERTELSLRSHYYVKALFGEEANKVILDIKRLEGLLLGLKEPVEQRKKKLDQVEECEKEASSLRGKLAALEEMENSISSASSRVEALRQERDELEKKMALLRMGPEWERLESLKRERVEVEKAIEAVERECADFCAPVGAALEKVKKLSGSGRFVLSGREKELASMDFLGMSGKDADELVAWLSKDSSDGSLQLKDKVMERLVQRLPLLAGSLERYRKEHSRLHERRGAVEASLDGSEANRHVQAICWKLERISHELEDISIGRLEKKKEALEGEVAAGEKRLAGLLNGLAGKGLEFSLAGAPP